MVVDDQESERATDRQRAGLELPLHGRDATADARVGGSRLGGIVSQPALVLVNAGVLVICVVAAAALSTAAQWRPLNLFFVLAVFATVSELSTVAFPILRRSLSAVA